MLDLRTCGLQSIQTGPRLWVRVDHSCSTGRNRVLSLSFRHFELTQHTYTMDLKRQHVWDYVGDNYVHRLIQNKSDGKLVELRGEGVSTYEIVRDYCLLLSAIDRSAEHARMIFTRALPKRTPRKRRSTRSNSR